MRKMPLVIRFDDGRVAGRMDIGEQLRPVPEEFAHIFDYHEQGQAEVLAGNLGGYVTNTNNSHQGFVVGAGKWPGRCRECGVAFEGIRPCMTLCHDCWYRGEIQSAEGTFTALATLVRAAGFRTEVLQTGGMVMCLAGYPTDQPLPYFMWGDPAEFNDPSFCVYVQDEDTTQDLIVAVEKDELLPAALARWEEWVALARDPNTEEVTAE